MIASTSKTTPLRQLLEVGLPLAALMLWKWLEPFGHSRILDTIFGILLALCLLLIIAKQGFPTIQEAGLSPQSPHAKATIFALLTVLPLIAILVVGAYFTGRLYADKALFRAVVFYPFGALVQEAVVFLFILPRMESILGARGGIIATALLFGAIHLPNPLLTIGSCLLVLTLYRGWTRYRSLIALAIAHGVLGAVCDKAVHVSMRIGASWFRS